MAPELLPLLLQEAECAAAAAAAGSTVCWRGCGTAVTLAWSSRLPALHCTLRSQRCACHSCCMQAYTDPLRGDVKAVGSSLVCLPEVDAGEPGCAEGFAS